MKSKFKKNKDSIKEQNTTEKEEKTENMENLNEQNTNETQNTENAEVITEADLKEANAEDIEVIKNALGEKLEDAKDKFLRKVAEFDNFKKRTAKEKTENFSLGICEAVEKLLPVLDNLDRAITSAEENDDKEALLDGIKMIRKQFSDALNDIGVSEIEAVGTDFDPEKHNAVMMEDSDMPSNTVTEEFAKGYIYKKSESERVVRHSMVKVSN